MNVGKLQEVVMDGEAWRAAVQGSQSTGRLSNNSPSVGDGLGVNVDPVPPSPTSERGPLRGNCPADLGARGTHLPPGAGQTLSAGGRCVKWEETQL